MPSQQGFLRADDNDATDFEKMFADHCENVALAGQVALRGESGWSPLEGTAQAEVFCTFHVSMKLFRDDAAGCCRSGVWRHARKTGVFLFLSVAVLVLPDGTAAAIEGHVVESSQDTRHEFSGRFPLLPISLFC